MRRSLAPRMPPKRRPPRIPDAWQPWPGFPDLVILVCCPAGDRRNEPRAHPSSAPPRRPCAALCACGKSEAPPAPAAPAAPAAAPAAAPRRTRRSTRRARRPRRGCRPRRRRSTEARGRRGVRLRVPDGADGGHAPAAGGRRGTERVRAPPRRAGPVGHRHAESERRFPVLAGVARPVEGAGDPVGAGHQGSLLPDRDARRLDQRRLVARQAHDRHGEARVRDHRSAVEGGDARVRDGDQVAHRDGVAVRPHRGRRRRERRRPSPSCRTSSRSRRCPSTARRDARPRRHAPPRRRPAKPPATLRPRSRRWTQRRSSRTSPCCCPAIRRPRTTRPMLDKIQALGLVPGQPFDVAKLRRSPRRACRTA